MDKNRDFDLVTATVKNDSVFVAYTDWIEGTRKNDDVVIEGRTVKRPVPPHADLMGVWDSFKDYLMRSQGHYDILDEALKYLTGEKKQNVVDKFNALKQGIKVTSVEISGKNDLRGVIIKGTHLCWGQNKPIKTTKILFKGESIGIETNVEGDCELLEEEIKKYLFANKKGEKDLFDKDPNERGGETPAEDSKSEPMKKVS